MSNNLSESENERLDPHRLIGVDGIIPTVAEMAEREKKQQALRDEAQKVRDEEYKSNQFLLTVALVVCNLLGLAFTYYQATISKTAADAARVSAAAAQNANKLAQHIADNSLREMEAQTTAASDSSDFAQDSATSSRESAFTAKTALDQGALLFRLENRAWLELDPIHHTVDARFPNGDVFVYDIYARNIGKTVARNVVIKASGVSGPEVFGQDARMIAFDQDASAIDSQSGEPSYVPDRPGSKTLAPGATNVVPFKIRANRRRMNSKGEATLSYLVGFITYSDTFDIAHWLKYCYVVANEDGDLDTCQQGNDEDQNNDSTLTSVPFDFRKERWGMSEVAVLQAEKTTPIHRELGKELIYHDTYEWRPCDITFSFVRGRLARVTLKQTDLTDPENTLFAFTTWYAAFARRYGIRNLIYGPPTNAAIHVGPNFNDNLQLFQNGQINEVRAFFLHSQHSASISVSMIRNEKTITITASLREDSKIILEELR